MSEGDAISIPGRPLTTRRQAKCLFDIEPDWKDHWWGMPSFEMGDARPQHKITINFMTAEDVKAFAEKTGLPVGGQSDTAWFPHQQPLRGQYFYDGPKTDSKYPVCIPSKGRADCQKTGKALERLGEGTEHILTCPQECFFLNALAILCDGGRARPAR